MLGNRTRVHFDTKSSEAESESSLQSARTARGVLVSRDRDAPARHTVSKNYFVPLLTLLVCLFLRRRDALDCKRSFSNHVRTTRGLQNWTLCTTKHLPTRHRLRPHHCRWGRCRCCRRRRQPGRLRPGRRRRRSCGGEKQVKFIALDKAFPSDYEQAAAAGKPQTVTWARGLLGTRDIVCDIGKLNDPIS